MNIHITDSNLFDVKTDLDTNKGMILMGGPGFGSIEDHIYDASLYLLRRPVIDYGRKTIHTMAGLPDRSCFFGSEARIPFDQYKIKVGKKFAYAIWGGGTLYQPLLYKDDSMAILIPHQDGDLEDAFRQILSHIVPKIEYCHIRSPRTIERMVRYTVENIDKPMPMIG